MTLKTLMMAAVLLLPATAFAQKSNGPQLVQSVDDAVRNAVSLTFQCTPDVNSPTLAVCTTDYTVPAGYRLAITQVTLQVVQSPPPAVDPPWLVIQARLNGQVFAHIFPATRAAGRWAGTTNSFFVVDELSPGSFVVGAVASSYVMISGHLVRM